MLIGSVNSSTDRQSSDPIDLAKLPSDRVSNRKIDSIDTCSLGEVEKPTYPGEPAIEDGSVANPFTDCYYFKAAFQTNRSQIEPKRTLGLFIITTRDLICLFQSSTSRGRGRHDCFQKKKMTAFESECVFSTVLKIYGLDIYGFRGVEIIYTGAGQPKATNIVSNSPKHIKSQASSQLTSRNSATGSKH
jgi:hypothetical protein